MLIKSFEGFRPRAIQRAEGGWIIGYGHTLSAREGATVSEADAELLLRYDLLPVEKTVNENVPVDLNQHQFDALVSFAFSVGVDRFASSDVRHCLTAGSPGEAADALMGWPEPALPQTTLRRRAAERALFVANPGIPVALSDLLSAPLPPPPVVAPAVVAPPVEEDPVEEIPAEEPQVEAPPPAEPAPVVEDEASAAVDPRSAAVAALLGEPPARLIQDEAATETSLPAEVEPPSPSNDNPPAEIADEESVLPVEAVPGEAQADAEPAPAEAPAESTPPPADPAAGWSATRYAPYGMAMIGPLPYLQNAEPKAEPKNEQAVVEAPVTDESVVEATSVSVETSPVPEPTPEPEPETVIPFAPEAAMPVVGEPVVIEPEPVAPTPVEPMAYVAPVDPASRPELVLTPLEDAPQPAFVRPLWTAEDRDTSDGSQNSLFGEELTLTMGGSVMRHEIEAEAPARFDWSDTGPFIFMGGVGLVSFGAAMAAFRRAAEQSGAGELTIIGWVLALIGLACVGVSSVNLYRKFGLPGGD